MTDNQPMTQQLTSNDQQQFVQAVYEEVTQMIKNGQTAFRIQQSLVERGLKLEDARAIVSQLQEAENKALQNQATKQKLSGVIVCIIGIAFAWAIYANNLHIGFYALATIIAISGAWLFLYGMTLMND